MLRAVRSAWLDRRLLAVASAPAAGDGSHAVAVNRQNAAHSVTSDPSLTVPQPRRTVANPATGKGDLIIGARNRTAVVTLTERVTRHTLLAALPNGYRAPHTAQAISDAFSRVPKPLQKTLTWDQGREMSEWCSVEQQTGLSVYFCDPRSPWQRPTNEHTNGMLRRWLPKSTNLNIGQIPLSIIEDNLNLMPRRLHNWHSPHDLYNQLTSIHR